MPNQPFPLHRPSRLRFARASGRGGKRETTTPSAAPPRRRPPRAEAPRSGLEARPHRAAAACQTIGSRCIALRGSAPLHASGRGGKRETTTPSAAPPRRHHPPRAEAPRSGLEARPHRAAASCQTSRSRCIALRGSASLAPQGEAESGKPPLHPQPLRAAAPLVLRRREAASKHARTAPPPRAKPSVPAASPFEAPLRSAPQGEAESGKPPLHPQPLRAATAPLVLRRREAASKHARTAPPPHAKPPVPATSPFEAPLRSAPQGEGERRETTTPSAAPPRRRRLPRAEAPRSGLEARPHRAAASCQTSRSR